MTATSERVAEAEMPEVPGAEAEPDDVEEADTKDDGADVEDTDSESEDAEATDADDEDIPFGRGAKKEKGDKVPLRERPWGR